MLYDVKRSKTAMKLYLYKFELILVFQVHDPQNACTDPQNAGGRWRIINA